MRFFSANASTRPLPLNLSMDYRCGLWTAFLALHTLINGRCPYLSYLSCFSDSPRKRGVSLARAHIPVKIIPGFIKRIERVDLFIQSELVPHLLSRFRNKWPEKLQCHAQGLAERDHHFTELIRLTRFGELPWSARLNIIIGLPNNFKNSR